MLGGTLMKRLVWLACFAYLLTGIGHIILGSVLEPLIKHYNVTYSDGGQLIMNQFFGFLIGVLFTPFLIKKLGRRITLLLAMILFATVQLSLFSLIPWNSLLVIIPFSGAGFGIIETLLAGMIVAELKEKKASIMVLTELCFGIGALTIPLVAAFLIATGEWNSIFLFVSILVSISFFLWLFVRVGQYEYILRKKPEIHSGKDVIKKTYTKPTRPLLILGSIFFFLYVGLEMTFPNYLPTIMAMTSNLSNATIALSITVFWGAMTVGRLLMIFIVNRFRIWNLFIVMVVGQMVSIGLFALSPNATFSFIVIFIAGILMGGIFSLGLLVINGGIPGLEDRTTSILIAMGGLGGALLPKFAGNLLDQYPVHVTLWFMFAFSVVMTLLLFFIHVSYKRLNVEDSTDIIKTTNPKNLQM